MKCKEENITNNNNIIFLSDVDGKDRTECVDAVVISKSTNRESTREENKMVLPKL
jgi:hypothetical protein